MTNNISTLNNPKHLVTLGRKVPKRFNREKYENIVEYISSRFRNYFNINRSSYVFVKPTRNRSSFGDIDMIVHESSLRTGWEKLFAENVLSKSFFANIPGTNTTVFEYGDYQINVHVTNMDVVHVSNYLRNEGTGELISIMLDHIGLVFDTNGLSIKTGIESNPLLKVVTSGQTIFRISGVSPDNWENYCYNSNDVYAILVSSAFFNRKVFLDLKTDTDRVLKSPVLANFIQYLENNPSIRGEVEFDVNNPNSAKMMTLNFRSLVPNTLTSYTELVQRNKINILFNEKFNLEKVSELTELSREDTIPFMNSFADSFKDDSIFKKFVLTSLPETLNKAILDHKASSVKLESKSLPELENIPSIKVKAVVKKSKKSEASPAKTTKVKAKTKTKIVKTTAPEVAVLPPVIEASSDNSFALAA